MSQSSNPFATRTGGGCSIFRSHVGLTLVLSLMTAIACTPAAGDPSASGGAGGKGTGGATTTGGSGATAGQVGSGGHAGMMALPDSGSVNGGSGGMATGGGGGSAVDANTTSPDVPADTVPPNSDVSRSETPALPNDTAPNPNSDGCSPQINGALKVSGDVVLDERTCLNWMRRPKEAVNLNPMFPPDALTFCEQLQLGGHDDWRVPTVDELASIITRCGKYPPAGPWDAAFEVSGDGYWTTTSAGAPHKVCAIGTDNAGKFYEYGTDGPQRVRCVRGKGTVRHARDCTTGADCSNWYQ